MKTKGVMNNQQSLIMYVCMFWFSVEQITLPNTLYLGQCFQLQEFVDKLNITKKVSHSALVQGFHNYRLMFYTACLSHHNTYEMFSQFSNHLVDQLDYGNRP